MTDEAPTRAAGAFRLERAVGTASGVAIEIWAAQAETPALLLVAHPSTSGFTVLMRGDPEDAEAFAMVGKAALRAVAGTAPLLSGEWFRPGRNGINDCSSPDIMP